MSKNNPNKTNPKQTSREKWDETLPLTPETLEDYVYQNGDDTEMLIGYMDATNVITRVIDGILKKASNFEELKKELLAFHNERIRLLRGIPSFEEWYQDTSVSNPKPS